MKRGRTKTRPVSVQGENIGVHVYRSEHLITKVLLCHPVVKVYIYDASNGHLLPKSSISRDETENEYLEPLVTKQFDFDERRSVLPIWDETLIFEEDISVLQTNQPSKLIMFEIADTINISLNTFKRKTTDTDSDWFRIAWAFLKPVGSDGTLNLNKQLRLQLYKIRKDCKISHHSCDIFHLYADHDLKKYPGSLYVTVKGLHIQTNQLINLNAEYSMDKKAEEKQQQDDSKEIQPENIKAEVQPHKWSRLPTQSCKIPQARYKELIIGRLGVSCLRFDAQGILIACGTLNKIYVYNMLTGDEVICFNGHNGLVYDLDWSENNSLLLSVSGDCTASIWNVQSMSQSPIQTLSHPSFVYSGKWLKSNSALITGCKDHVLRYWLKVNNEFELIQEIGGHHGFISALSAQNSSVLYSGDSSGYIFIWQYYDNVWSCLKKWSFREISHNVIDAIHLHPGERRLIVTARSKGSFMVDIASGVIIQVYKTMVNLCTRSVSCLSPCGSLFFSFGQNNVVSGWAVDTGKLLITYDNIFPIYAGNVEVSGYLHYHPFEHLLALSLLGQNYPLVLLHYDSKKNEVRQLGIRHCNIERTLTNEKTEITKYAVNQEFDGRYKTAKNKYLNAEMKENLLDKSNSDDFNPPITGFSGKESLLGQTTDDKLASVIKKIDKVLTASKVVKQFSNESR